MSIVSRTIILLFVSLTAAAFSQRSHTTTASDVFRNTKNSVVLIVGAGNEDIVQGSGFIQAANRVVTNFHVIEGRSHLYVKFSDGEVTQVQDVVIADKNLDLAVLAVPTGTRRPLPLGDELVLREGDNVLALGAPKGLQLTLTNGIVSSFRHDEHSFLIQTTAPIAPGSSGGPLLDSLGHVIGITTFRLTDSPGLYFSVAVSELKRLLRTTSTKSVNLATNDDELEGLRREIDAGRMEDARVRASTLLSRDPEDPKGLAISGIVAFHQNHPDEAVGFLSKAASREPESPLVQSYYSLALIRTGDFKRALSHARKAEAIQQNELSEQALALSAYLLNDLATAKKAAEQVLDFDEDNETALEVMTGVSYWGEPTAQTWLARAKEVKKVDPAGSWALILDWRESNPRDDKKLEMAKATRFPNEVPFIILSSAHLRGTTGANFHAAANELKPALLAMPENSRLLRTAIFTDLLADDFASATDHFSTLQNSTADPQQVHEAGCFYYSAIAKPKLAMQDCKAVVDAQPTNHTAHSNYGWASLDADEFKLAFEEFSTALRLLGNENASTTSEVDLVWGLILSNSLTGNEVEAKRLYEVLSTWGIQFTSVEGLKKLPLLFSKLQLIRIQEAHNKWHK